MALLETVLLLWYMLEYYLDVICYKLWGAEDRDEEDVTGKVVVISGGNSGIGKSLAVKLAHRGAVVVLGCHNMTKGKLAQDDIMFETKSRKVFLLHLDLENFRSVREFSDQVTKQFPQIHILINNAGICIDPAKLETSQNEHEKYMCINHLGHFLLSNLLLQNLQSAAPSRIIIISSSTMLFSELEIDDIMLQNHSNSTKRMCNPFMANCLFAKELGIRIRGTGVTTYSVCPGLCGTKIGTLTAKLLLSVFGLSPDKAADSILFCVLSRKCEHETGKFYRFLKSMSLRESKAEL